MWIQSPTAARISRSDGEDLSKLKFSGVLNVGVDVDENLHTSRTDEFGRNRH